MNKTILNNHTCPHTEKTKQKKQELVFSLIDFLLFLSRSSYHDIILGFWSIFLKTYLPIITVFFSNVFSSYIVHEHAGCFFLKAIGL